jgi:hypothetical protein
MKQLTFNRNHYRAIREGYRSGLEDLVAKQLQAAGKPFEYEPKEGKIEYTKPTTSHKYTPDFVFKNFIVETKGRFVTADRKRHKLIKDQHPDIDIRFVFSNSKTRISKTSKTTYAKWCELNGFKYADKLIPDSWLKEIK